MKKERIVNLILRLKSVLNLMGLEESNGMKVV